MDILIARPPVNITKFLYEDLGLEMIAASLRAAGHSCRFLDGEQLMMTDDAFVRDVSSASESIVCVGIHSEFNVDETLRLTSKIKKRDGSKMLILGGHPLYGLDEEIFRFYPDSFDVIVRGEGEDTIVELVDRLASGDENYEGIRGISFRKGKKLVRNEIRYRPAKYDSYPPASRDVWACGMQRPASQSALVYLSRGCDFCCNFCSVGPFHGSGQRKWIARPIDSFIEELSALHRQYDIKDFTIVDPNFLGNPVHAANHVEHFCSALKRSGLDIIFDIACRADSLTATMADRLYDVGWRRVFLGIESASMKDLARWHKAIDPRQGIAAMRMLAETGVLMEVGYILLSPETTLDDLRMNLSFLRKLPYFNPSVFASHIWPIHASLESGCLKERYIIRYADRLSFAYRFKRAEIAEYYRISAWIVDAYWNYFSVMHRKTWNGMFEDPGIIGRYAVAMRDLLDLYQDILDEIVVGIGRSMRPEKLDVLAERLIERHRGTIRKVSHDFR